MASNKSDFIDISELIRQYINKWWLFLISFIVCAGLAFVYCKIHKPEYAVRANVLINQEEETGSPTSMAMGMTGLSGLFGNNGFVYDEIFIISSHSLYKDVAKDLSLGTKYFVRKGFLNTTFAYEDYPIEIIPTAGMLDTLSVSLSFKLKVKENGKVDIEAKARKNVFAEVEEIELPYTLQSDFGTFTFTKTDNFIANKDFKEVITIVGYDSAAEELDVAVSSEIASKRSNVVEMGINTPYPDYGKNILNKIIELYNKRTIVQKNEKNDLTSQFIDGRLKILTKDLNDIEIEIQNYKQKRGIIDVGLEAGKQFQKQTEFENALLELRTQQEIIRMASDFLSDPANEYSLVPITSEAEDVPGGLEAYNALLLQRQDLLTSARADNAALKLLDEKIKTLRDNIKASFAKTLDNINLRIRDIQRNMADATAKLGAAPLSEREFLNLKRQQELKQSLYLFLLQRKEEVSMALANSFPKGTVVDSAFTLSEPLGMSNKIIFILAVLFSLILPPIALFVRRLITNVIESRNDVEKATDIPLLGEMCEDKSGDKIVAVNGNKSSAAELFRMLRSNLLFVLNSSTDKVVLLTSSVPGEGKSFISLNIAASLAALGKKVIIVGMDIRKPTLAQYIGISPKYGVTQYLSSQSLTIDQIIEKVPGVDNLDTIVAGPVPPNPAELLASGKVDQLFAELRGVYDYIIVDTAPLGLVSDTFTLDRVADATICVCRLNKTKMTAFKELNDIYEHNRLKKLSIVINGSKSRKEYGYGN